MFPFVPVSHHLQHLSYSVQELVSVHLLDILQAYCHMDHKPGYHMHVRGARVCLEIQD